MRQAENLTIAEMQQEILELKAQNVRLQMRAEHLESRQLTVENIRLNKLDCAYYTGMLEFGVFNSLFEYFEPRASEMKYWRREKRASHETRGRPRQFDLKEEFFMVLVRLRTGMPGKEIARNFGISEGHFSRVFATWINFLRLELKGMTRFPTCGELQGHLPTAFGSFPDTRVVLDGTEVRVQKPSSLAAQRQTFSYYKHYNTYKAIVGCTPNGYICYVSKLWGGSVSDRKIIEEGGLLEQLQPGDAIMVDKGFILHDLPPGVRVHIPCFRKPGEPQMGEHEVAHTQVVAGARVIVERVIGRVKQFHILDRPFPITMIDIAEQVFQVCCYLSNFRGPLYNV